MNATRVEQDERITAVENAGYRLAWLLMAFGLLVVIGYRSFAHQEQAWDLFALLLLSSGVHAAYTAQRSAVTGRRALMFAATVAAGALVAVVLMIIGR